MSLNDVVSEAKITPEKIKHGMVQFALKSLEYSIFEHISELAGLFFIDVADISIHVSWPNEENVSVIDCRICNLEYSQKCSSEILLREKPATIAAIFFRNMLKEITELCIARVPRPE